MNLDKCIMFKVLLSKVLKSQYFLKARILVFWTRQWGTCFCRVRCSGGSISLPISRCISLWAHRSVSLHSIVSRTFYFFPHILYFLHIPFFAHYEHTETYHHHHWSWFSSPLFIQLYRILTKPPRVKNNPGVRSSAKTTRKKPWECQQQTWELANVRQNANVRRSLFSSVVDLLK